MAVPGREEALGDKNSTVGCVRQWKIIMANLSRIEIMGGRAGSSQEEFGRLRARWAVGQ